MFESLPEKGTGTLFEEGEIEEVERPVFEKPKKPAKPVKKLPKEEETPLLFDNTGHAEHPQSGEEIPSSSLAQESQPSRPKFSRNRRRNRTGSTRGKKAQASEGKKPQQAQQLQRTRIYKALAFFLIGCAYVGIGFLFWQKLKSKPKPVAEAVAEVEKAQSEETIPSDAESIKSHPEKSITQEVKLSVEEVWGKIQSSQDSDDLSLWVDSSKLSEEEAKAAMKKLRALKGSSEKLSEVAPNYYEWATDKGSVILHFVKTTKGARLNLKAWASVSQLKESKFWSLKDGVLMGEVQQYAWVEKTDRKDLKLSWLSLKTGNRNSDGNRNPVDGRLVVCDPQVLTKFNKPGPAIVKMKWIKHQGYDLPKVIALEAFSW